MWSSFKNFLGIKTDRRDRRRNNKSRELSPVEAAKKTAVHKNDTFQQIPKWDFTARTDTLATQFAQSVTIKRPLQDEGDEVSSPPRKVPRRASPEHNADVNVGSSRSNDPRLPIQTERPPEECSSNAKIPVQNAAAGRSSDHEMLSSRMSGFRQYDSDSRRPSPPKQVVTHSRAPRDPPQGHQRNPEQQHGRSSASNQPLAQLISRPRAPRDPTEGHQRNPEQKHGRSSASNQPVAPDLIPASERAARSGGSSQRRSSLQGNVSQARPIAIANVEFKADGGCYTLGDCTISVPPDLFGVAGGHLTLGVSALPETFPDLPPNLRLVSDIVYCGSRDSVLTELIAVRFPYRSTSPAKCLRVYYAPGELGQPAQWVPLPKTGPNFIPVITGNDVCILLKHYGRFCCVEVMPQRQPPRGPRPQYNIEMQNTEEAVKFLERLAQPPGIVNVILKGDSGDGKERRGYYTTYL